MRVSELFGQTLRQAPAEADVASYQLLVRAEFIRQLGAGIFSSLPLGLRTIHKIEGIIRQEIDAIGGQEMSMPVAQPVDIWKESGRWYQIGAEMARFTDRADRDMVLGMTHEEVIADLVRREIRSYRDLPKLVYQIQTKFRDEPRPRAGLIRVREFIMKDSYSLDQDYEGLDEQYRRHYQAYFNIYRRCGLPVIAVRSDVGMMGGKMAHEFMYLTPIGEDTLLLCDADGYAANREVATFVKPAAAPEAPKPVEKVHTPGASTIEALAQFLGITPAQTAKAYFAMAEVPAGDGYAERLVIALVRGDMEVNEMKLTNAVHARALRLATDDEIRASGAVPGYGSAVGVTGALVVVDDSVSGSPNLAAGANEEGYHLVNTNYGRDYTADVVTDIAAAREGDMAPGGGGPLRAVRGVEVGNIFKLGTRYTDALNCTFLDKDGAAKPVIMGSYGIGVGRLMACIAEERRDERGLIWPVSVAPFDVSLVLVNPGEAEAKNVADGLYNDLTTAGFDVLYDDRDERPGVKFNDADLIGIPVRVTVGAKSLAAGGVEVKLRSSSETKIVSTEHAVGYVQGQIGSMHAAIWSTIKDEPFRE